MNMDLDPMGASDVAVVDVDVVIPVFNEGACLETSVRRLHQYLTSRFPASWTITIADNASTDDTWAVARHLADELDHVRTLHLDQKGRGRALRSAWESSHATVVAYMDVDLSTDLDAFLPLVAPLLSGHSDVAIGTRLARGAQVERGPRREVISRIYNAIVRTMLRTSFTDAQCGFKAVRSDVATALLPLVEDQGWFFDTELLAVAEHNGFRIHEVPVDWIDDPDSRVDVASTARADLAGIARVLRRLSSGEVTLPDQPSAAATRLGPVDQLVRFAWIGLISTVAAAILFVLMAPAIGTVAANVVAFGICALANSAANRRFTFAVRGRAGRSRHFLGALALGAVPLVVSTVGLVLLDLAGVTGLVLPLVVVVVTNAAMAALKFTLLRSWVFALPGTDEQDAGAGTRPPPWIARWWRGRPEDPEWYRPALLALLCATAIAYIWGLGASGWANGFYSAAVQAGATSWKAFFFGSFDASNAITVDKAPGALWVMDLSARLFGVNPWSILVPEALMGVASVALVAATVKRWFRPGAALMAGLVLATTPVAVLMFRFNNPDALLVLLLCGAAYATTRAIEHASWRWITAAGALIGFAFLAKMLQAFLVLPALTLAYLVAAPTAFWKRVGHLAAMGAAMVLSAGWWVAIVDLWPASSRPYIGGSQHNSVMELVIGYNGLGRITGHETGAVSRTAANGAGQWGPTGWSRMFNSSFGGQISWLLPAAMLLLAAGLVWSLRQPRTDRSRAALIIWGGWLMITGAVFSLSGGIIHQYYTVALAPAIAAVVGIGGSMAWDRREQVGGRAVMATGVVVTAAWTAVLVGRTPGWNQWLTPTTVTFAAVAVVLVLMGERIRRGAVTAVAAGVTLAAGTVLLAPFAASATTADTPHRGAIVTAGPTVRPVHRRHPGGTGPGAPAAPPAVTTTANPAIPEHAEHRAASGMSTMLRQRAVSPGLVDVLTAGPGRFEWLVATTWSMNAASYALATGQPALAVGGFNGTDPAPTLNQFKHLVARHRVHWYVGTSDRDLRAEQLGGSQAAARISDWVAAHFTPRVVDGRTLYDLTQAPAASEPAVPSRN